MGVQPEIERDGEVEVLAACREGQVERVRDSLTRGEASVETRDEKGYPLLSIAAAGGHAAIVKLLLKYGASVDYASGTNLPALILASLLDHLDVVRLLLKYGASVDQSVHGITALSCACTDGFVEVGRALIDSGSNVDEVDEDGSTPLIHAAHNGHLASVALLLDHGASVDWADNVGCTSLMKASYGGYTDVVVLLLEKGAQVDRQDRHGSTALAVSCDTGNVDVAQVLLQGGAAVDLAHEDGTTPLIRAALEGHVAVAHLLLDFGASIEMTNAKGVSALIAAILTRHVGVIKLISYMENEAGAHGNEQLLCGESACEGGNLEPGRVLIKLGATIDVANYTGSTPLTFAAQAQGGYSSLVELLLGNGASLDTVNELGATALLDASEGDHVAVIKLLLERGEDVNKQLKLVGGATALALACATGRVNADGALIAGGASVALSDQMGTDPLLLATIQDHSEAVALLLGNGADANKQYPGGYTALNTACELGFLSVAEALIKGGSSTDLPDQGGI